MSWSEREEDLLRRCCQPELSESNVVKLCQYKGLDRSRLAIMRKLRRMFLQPKMLRNKDGFTDLELTGENNELVFWRMALLHKFSACFGRKNKAWGAKAQYNRRQAIVWFESRNPAYIQEREWFCDLADVDYDYMMDAYRRYRDDPDSIPESVLGYQHREGTLKGDGIK